GTAGAARHRHRAADHAGATAVADAAGQAGRAVAVRADAVHAGAWLPGPQRPRPRASDRRLVAAGAVRPAAGAGRPAGAMARGDRLRRLLAGRPASGPGGPPPPLPPRAHPVANVAARPTPQAAM